MIISFDSHLAEEYGLNESIFLGNLIYWVKSNQNLSYCEFEGRTWMYHTYNKLSENIFHFWSWDSIKRIVHSLRNQNVIMTRPCENNNKGLWFALVDQTRFMARAYPQPQANSPKVEESETIPQANSPRVDSDPQANSPRVIDHTNNININNNILNNNINDFSQLIAVQNLPIVNFINEIGRFVPNDAQAKVIGVRMESYLAKEEYSNEEGDTLEDLIPKCSINIQAIALLAVINHERAKKDGRKRGFEYLDANLSLARGRIKERGFETMIQFVLVIQKRMYNPKFEDGSQYYKPGTILRKSYVDQNMHLLHKESN